MPELELVARVAIYLPLALIAYQTVVLSQLLPSRAWVRTMIGFLLIALLRGYALLAVPATAPYVTILLVAYALIAWGFQTLINDIRRVREIALTAEQSEAE